MNVFWMILFLAVGIYLAVKLTQLVNWFTFGQNAASRMDSDDTQDKKDPGGDNPPEEK